MKPELFLETRMGWTSSHPIHQRRRRLWSQALALVPLAIIVVLGVFVALNIDAWRLDINAWKEAIQSARSWLTVIGCAVSLALGALITLALTARWGELQQRGKVSAVVSRGESYLERWVALAALGLGVFGPVLALCLPSAGQTNGIRFACHLFAVLPLVGVLVGMWCLGGQVDQRKATRKRRPIWALLASLVLAVLVLTLVQDLVQGSDVARPFLRALVLAPLCYLLLVIWRLFPATVPVAPPDDEKEEQAPRQGRLSRAWGWIKSLFVPRSDQGKAESDDVWPGWLDELLEQLPEGCRCVNGPERLHGAEEASPSDAAELKPLFGGAVPTSDQLQLLQRFSDSYQEAINASCSSSHGRSERRPSANLLVEGDRGSGRTTALVACAVYAALGRGQRVLFLVANEQRQNIVKRRIDDRLKSFNVGFYVHSGTVSETAVAEWLAAKKDEPPVIPHILIGTLDAVERHLYGAPHLDDGAVARLRRLITLLDVVLVDDYMDFDDVQRSHLPFVLDKQRLLMEADFASLQVVVTCPPLARIARRTFGSRLYTERLLQLDRNVIRLRPRKSSPAWQVDLEAEEVRDAVDKMVVWCLRHEIDVVLYRRGIDEGERGRLEADLRDLAGNQQTLTVLSDLDQPLAASSTNVEAIFYQVAANHDICLALRLHLGNADSVIFSVRPTDEVRGAPVPGIVPVVADRSAVSLMVAHLRSAVRFLRRGTPIRESTWLQFGVSFGKLQAVRPSDSPETIFRRDSWSTDDSNYASLLWPYVYVPAHPKARTSAGVVDSHALPDETYGLLRYGANEAYFVGRVRSRKREGKQGNRFRRRWVSWQSAAGQPMYRSTDLAHAREFRIVDGRQVFVPHPRILAEKAGYRFTTQHWHGNGEDAYLPVYAIEWETTDDSVAATLGGGPDHGIQMFNLDSGDGKPIVVEATIEKLMTEYGVETPIEPLEFSYHARLSGILLLPRDIESEKLDTAIGQSLAGRWGTAGSFCWSAVLTAAVNYALQARLPGLSFFAPSLTFWLDQEDTRICDAVTWFIEPTDVGQTVMPILGRLLSDSRERQSFFQSVEWFLGQVDRVERKQRFLRRFSRIGYYGDENIERIAESQSLVRDVLGHTNT